MTGSHLNCGEPGLLVALHSAMHHTGVLLMCLCCLLHFNCWLWLRPSATSLPSQHCLWHSVVLVSSSYEVTPPQLLLDDACAL